MDTDKKYGVGITSHPRVSPSPVGAIVESPDVLHIEVYERDVETRRQGRRPKVGPTYRGIQLQQLGGHTRFTPDQIRQAVVAAIAKNADAFVRKV